MQNLRREQSQKRSCRCTYNTFMCTTYGSVPVSAEPKGGHRTLTARPCWSLWPPHLPRSWNSFQESNEESRIRQLDVVPSCSADLFDFSGTSVPGRVGAAGCPQSLSCHGGYFSGSDATRLTSLANSCVLMSFWHQTWLEQPWEAGTLETPVSCSSHGHKCSIFAMEEDFYGGVF